MAPPQQPTPVTPHSRSLIRQAALHEGGGGGGGRRGGNNHHPSVLPKRSSSFHGRIMGPSSDPNKIIMSRPKTQPDLLAGAGADWKKMKEAQTQCKASGDHALKLKLKLKLKRLEQPASAAATDDGSSSRSSSQIIVGRRVPAKVLVNVNVQRSLGAVQVMASTEWSVKDLIAATLKQYVKEGRRPLLPSNNPSSLTSALFGLHYSQFSLESLDPEEKLIGLGSRNFFLCPNSSSVSAASSVTPSTTTTSASATCLPPPAAAPSSTSTSSSCSNEADNLSKTTFSWLRFKQLARSCPN